MNLSTSTWGRLVLDFLADEAGDWDRKTLAYHRARLAPFVAYLDENEIETIEARPIKRFFAEQKAAGLSWSTRNGTYTSLRMFCRWLKRSGVFPENSDPFLDLDSGLKRPRKTRRQPKTIPMDYIRRMISAAESGDDLASIRDAAIMHLLISTGIRRAEVTSLRIDDLDLQAGEILITGKYDTERYAYLKPEATGALFRWLAVRPGGSQALFTSLDPVNLDRQGQPLRPGAINDILLKYRALAGLPGVSVSPHRWRHTFASEFAKRSRNVFALRDLMGHSDVSVTSIYVNLDRPALRRLALGVSL